MSTLFNNNAEGGYRLRTLEIFNWGTFHNKIFKIEPKGRTSLLTGANGSGKTTLIDALLTLLVPSNKRFYNQSSGAEAKKERDENSYFWGYHGKTYSDADDRSQTEQLRSKSDNPYSVLLAFFQNSATLHTITLVQVRWFSGGAIKKVFIVSPYPLNIHEHFGEGKFDLKGEWKRKLQKQFPKTELFESFKEYAARFSDLFGLKEKALSLFNQTVGIKVLGDLTQFIRQQMLEEPDAEEQFKNLYDHYTDLLISHKAIQKDEKQLELLEPVVRNKEVLAHRNQELQSLIFIGEQLPFFLDKLEDGLLETHIAEIEKEVEQKEKEQKLLEGTIRELEEEQKSLITQKASLNIDTKIQLLQKDLLSETEKREAKKKDYTIYQNLAGRIGLNTEINETSFWENVQQVEKLKTTVQESYDKLNYDRFRTENEKELVSDKIETIQNKITSLLSRKNRLPEELIAVRERLLNLLETGEDELPFVGELIKVREDCLHWEDAIERVLHSFSLRLLVPETFNKQVNHFVHTHNLKARLVYERIERRSGESLLRWPADNNSLLNKIELKKSALYTKWLETQLVERFDYYCTDDLEVFYGSRKAITSNGLIRNANRHEKDDRPDQWHKRQYTLGWDNKATVQLLQEEKYTLEQQHNKLFRKLQELTPDIDALKNKSNLLSIVAEKKFFDDINWQQHAEKIEDISRQIEELKTSSDKYQTISNQLDEVESRLREKRKDKDNVIRRLEQLNQEYNQKNSKRLKLEFEKLTHEGSQAIEDFLKDCAIKNILPDTLDQLELLIKQTDSTLKAKLNAVRNALKELEQDTISYINAFVHPNEGILKEFPDWSGDVLNIAANLHSMDELEDLYKNIRNQRLVEHKRRFREYMDRSMLDALTNFRTWLINEEEKIKEVIEELNVPLKKITFNRNPDTYLQLECRATRDQEIKPFKDQLSAAIPNTLEFATQKDEAIREKVFHAIKELITELQKEETWRRKVTDIRNWLTFSAREYSYVDHKAGQYHDNTASYSGGQKAQFTYAILGAAIAHQFGIYQPGKQHKSLRFITVDEAFSKLDPEKSQFLMEFCAQLNLQLLVVTPLDKINIAEPYIHAVHFVEIKNKKLSTVYNLNMEEYEEKREEFKQLSKLTDDNP